MKWNRSRKLGWTCVVASIGLVGALLSLPLPASAAVARPSKVVHGTMNELCRVPPSLLVGKQNLTAPAIAALCNSPQATRPSSGISPNNTVSGNCGTTGLYLFDDGGGNALVDATANSILGPILFGSATIQLYNFDIGYPVDHNVAITANNGPDGWYLFQSFYTAEGTVTGEIVGGDVALADGNICGLLSPYSSTTVT